MSTPLQIVVCGSFVPDPLQTLEPVTGPSGPSLKNEMMLPAALDPWAGHALFAAAALAAAIAGIAGLDRARLLLFGGWESASRGAGSTMQMVAERLGITEQFQG